MSLFIASLNSGSNGNCYYIGNDRDAVLVDAGLSCRETERRMLQLGLNLKIVRGVFISHEHTDHIKGVEVLSRKYRIPVHISARTLEHSRLMLEHDLVRQMKTDSAITVNSLVVRAFPKFHDAAEPCSFVVEGNGINIGVFTDIGNVCATLTTHFRQCHAAFLEANYDEEMLERGPYPYHLKRRISGGRGHLSNHQALELFRQHRPPHMSHLLLSHLSKDNNVPELAASLFREYCGNVAISVASRYGVSGVLQISTSVAAQRPQEAQYSRKAEQMALF